MKGIRPLVGLTVAAGLLLVGAATMVDAQHKPLTIRLGVHSSIMGAADVIAVRQGYFKQEGLEVDARKFALGKEGRDAMIAGRSTSTPRRRRRSSSASRRACRTPRSG